jgi:transposase InsO family protein
MRVVERIWEKAGHPWSKRLKALLPVWLPWARKHIPELTPEIEEEVLKISARQMDRRLKEKKRTLKGKLYGRTKPGTLLKHAIPIKTAWREVKEPGYVEIDLVAHCGPCASGEFAYSLNLTDLYTGWVETRAILGKSEGEVVKALDEMRRQLPFPLRALKSDNGSEFINHHLFRYCGGHRLEFWRTRPYEKNDNAHIEQKNWTHVRKLFGWERYDTCEAVAAMNEVYRTPWRQMMNLFMPSVKLVSKERVGARLRRKYDAPLTPLDRLIQCYEKDSLPLPVQRLELTREKLDPFELSQAIDKGVVRVEQIRRRAKGEKETRAL